MFDENHVRKTLVADLGDFAPTVNLFVLNVLGSKETFRGFKLPAGAFAGVFRQCHPRNSSRPVLPRAPKSPHWAAPMAFTEAERHEGEESHVHACRSAAAPSGAVFVRPARVSLATDAEGDFGYSRSTPSNSNLAPSRLPCAARI